MAWGYKATITIDHTKCGTADSTNFPILVSGTYDGTGDEPDLRVTGSGGHVTSSSGYDICFYSDSALTTKLKHEIDTYTSTTGVVAFWVRIPTLSYETDTVIYMAYGDADITTSQEDKANTWVNYSNVWHLDDTDDSKGGNTLTSSSTTAGAVKIGNGQILNAGTDYLSLASAINLVDTYSLEWWSIVTGETTNGVVFTRVSGDGNNYVFGLEGSYVEINSYGGTRKNWNTVTSFTALHHFVITQVDGGNLYLYADGVQQAAKAENPTFEFSSIGGYISDAYSLIGKIDEVRVILGTAVGATYVTTSYNTQSSPSTFYTMGDETAVEAGGGGTGCLLNIGDAWKTVTALKINIGDSWKTVTKIQKNIGDAWKSVF